MQYNILVTTKYSSFNLMEISEEELQIIVDAYIIGKSDFTINGEKYWIRDLNKFKIFKNEGTMSLEHFYYKCIDENLLYSSGQNTYYPETALLELGNDVTSKFIGNMEFGEQRDDIKVRQQNGEYVNEERLAELRNSKYDKFDLTWLIKLCEELNDNFKYGNYLTVAMISRTILNHIPPIFGKNKFEEVVNNYGAPKENKSFKLNMKRLFESLKNIADRILHGEIRVKETLPNAIQVDFRQDFDVLLGEIVRILK